MLLGFCSATFEVLTWEVGTFFIAANIRVRASLRELVIVQVYGPADHYARPSSWENLKPRCSIDGTASALFLNSCAAKTTRKSSGWNL